MMFQLEIEKDEVKVKIQGKEYITALSADVEIEYTPPMGEVRARDNSCLEPPSGSCIDVMWAETILIIFNDQGEEIGTLVYKGVDFFESLVDVNEEDLDLERML